MLEATAVYHDSILKLRKNEALQQARRELAVLHRIVDCHPLDDNENNTLVLRHIDGYGSEDVEGALPKDGCRPD